MFALQEEVILKERQELNKTEHATKSLFKILQMDIKKFRLWAW